MRSTMIESIDERIGAIGAHVTMDDELIAICRDIANVNEDLERLAMDVDTPSTRAALRANHEHWKVLTTRAASLRATTLEGVRARAGAIGLRLLGDLLDGTEATDQAERALLAALLTDLRGPRNESARHHPSAE